MKNIKKAFTLIEIMVVIALMWIIALWASKLNFNSLSDRQKVDWFFYQIKNNIETTKNNALIWKEIKLADNSKIVPKKWRIDFNNSASGSIKTYYQNNSDTFINYPENNILTKKHYQIIISNNWSKLSDTWSLLIEWWNLNLTWSTILWSDKVLEIETKYKNLSKKFSINTISGVIEEK